MPSRRTSINPERRNPCTHTTMTRLFDPFDSFKCSLCHKHPALGWLYRCTQDSAGLLPESDFTSQPTEVQTKRLGRDVATHCLSTSIIKAIGEGQYTEDQVKTLIGQKEKVRDHVLAYQQPDNRPPTASTETSCSSSIDGTFSTLPQSPTFSTNSSATLDDEINAGYDWKELQKVWMSEPTLPPPECHLRPLAPRDLLHPKSPPVQACIFKICPTCRPTYRDRAYQSLDYILNNPILVPPIWEFHNRRLSDAKIVACIGLRDRGRFYAQTGPEALQSLHSIPGIVTDRSDEEQDFYDASSEPDGGDSEDKVTPSDTHSIRRRSGFRHTVRKALARARPDESLSTISTIDDSESAESLPSLSLIFRRQRSQRARSFVEAHGRVVDTSTLQESVMLMLATNTPLPHTPTLNRCSWMDSPTADRLNDPVNFAAADVITQA